MERGLLWHQPIGVLYGPEREIPLTRRTFALSSVDLIFILVLGIRAIVYQDLLLQGDGDLASHLALGQRMLHERALPTQDPLTFSMQGRPFVAHSWLGSLVLTLAYRAGGLPAVTVFATAVLALAYSLVALFLRRRDLDGRVVVAGAFTAVLLGTMHWLARPHIFTVLAAAILLHLLEAKRPRLWVFAALFAIWANLHGGFLFGLLLIGAYLLGAAGEARITRDPAWRALALRLLAAFGIAVIASCLNPYGPMIFGHLANALQDGVTVEMTHEYRSPNFHDTTVLILLAAIVATIAVLSVVRPRPLLTRLFAILVTLAATLYSARNIDVFSVTGWPLVWLSVGGVHLRRSGRYWLGDDFVRVERAAMPGPWMTAFLLLALVVVANDGRVAGRQLLRAGFSRARFPVEAVQAARAANLRGPLFTHFVWGGYVVLEWPGQRVFITGLKYDPDVAQAYVTVASVFPGWQQEMEDWGITQVLVPTESPLVDAMAQLSGWCVFHADSTATLIRQVSGAAGDSLCRNPRRL
jgi:hypothetical protein